jgi:uncharacterized protein (TIGR02246 family)
MNRTYAAAVTVLFLAASGVAALGQTIQRSVPPDEDVAGTVSILDHIWLDAARNHDAETAAWLFADDFIEIHPGGFLVNKQQQVDMIGNTKLGDLQIQSKDIQVRYAGPDVAILTDTTTIHGTQGDVPYDGKYRVMRVFVKQHGRWRAAGAGLATLKGD